MTAVGPLPRAPDFARESPPSRWPTDVRKSSLGTNVRFDWRMMIHVSRAFDAISGAPPAPGRRTLGFA